MARRRERIDAGIALDLMQNEIDYQRDRQLAEWIASGREVADFREDLEHAKQMAWHHQLKISMFRKDESEAAPRESLGHASLLVHEPHTEHSVLAESSRQASAPGPAKVGQTVECVACSENVPSTAAVKISCGHHMCGDCVRLLFDGATRDEQLFPPRCCASHEIDFTDASKFLDPELAARFELKAQELRTPAQDRIYCHDGECRTFVPPQHINGDLASCPTCGKTTCTFCKNCTHPRQDCPEDPARQQALALIRKEGWQQCKKCERYIELRAGCNHITCRCGHQFCYVCGARWHTCDCDGYDGIRLMARAREVVHRPRNDPMRVHPYNRFGLLQETQADAGTRDYNYNFEPEYARIPPDARAAARRDPVVMRDRRGRVRLPTMQEQIRRLQEQIDAHNERPRQQPEIARYPRVVFPQPAAMPEAGHVRAPGGARETLRPEQLQRREENLRAAERLRERLLRQRLERQQQRDVRLQPAVTPEPAEAPPSVQPKPEEPHRYFRYPEERLNRLRQAPVSAHRLPDVHLWPAATPALADLPQPIQTNIVARLSEFPATVLALGLPLTPAPAHPPNAQRARRHDNNAGDGEISAMADSPARATAAPPALAVREQATATTPIQTPAIAPQTAVPEAANDNTNEADVHTMAEHLYENQDRDHPVRWQRFHGARHRCEICGVDKKDPQVGECPRCFLQACFPCWQHRMRSRNSVGQE